MTSLRDKLKRLHAPNPTEAPERAVTAPPAPEPTPAPVAPKSPPVAPKPPPVAPRPAPVAPRPAPVAPEPPPLAVEEPRTRGAALEDLRARLDRVFAAPRRNEAKRQAARDAEPSRGHHDEVAEPVMRPLGSKRRPARPADEVAEPVMRPLGSKRRPAQPADEVAEPVMRPVAPKRGAGREPVSDDPGEASGVGEGGRRGASPAARAASGPARRAGGVPRPPDLVEGAVRSGVGDDVRHVWRVLRDESVRAAGAGDYAAAAAALRDMAALPSTDAWPFVELARLHEGPLARPDMAAWYLERAIERAPWNGTLKQNLQRLLVRIADRGQ
jgi:hypothetical protein